MSIRTKLPELLGSRVGSPVLGGSWVAISGVISRVTIVYS